MLNSPAKKMAFILFFNELIMQQVFSINCHAVK